MRKRILWAVLNVLAVLVLLGRFAGASLHPDRIWFEIFKLYLPVGPQQLGADIESLLEVCVVVMVVRHMFESTAKEYPSRPQPTTNDKTPPKSSIHLADHPSAEDGSPTWLSDLKAWVSKRTRECRFSSLDLASYEQQLCTKVLSFRNRVLTDEEFGLLCRATSCSLFLRSQLIIGAMERHASMQDALAAVFAVLPEYPSYWTYQQSLNGSISPRDIGTMQMLEGEMFGVLATHFLHEAGWIEKSLAEAKYLADKYWEEKLAR